jgi:hypothetical protein
MTEETGDGHVLVTTADAGDFVGCFCRHSTQPVTGLVISQNISQPHAPKPIQNGVENLKYSDINLTRTPRHIAST